jgi:hypothetical protein
MTYETDLKCSDEIAEYNKIVGEIDELFKRLDWAAVELYKNEIYSNSLLDTVSEHKFFQFV